MALGVRRLFRRRQAAWWTLAAGLSITAALGWEMHREAVEMDRQRLAMRAAEIQSQLDARLEKSEMLLQNLRDYLTLSGEGRNAVFQRWCYENGLSINCPWISGIAVATNRNEAQWRTHLPKPPTAWTTNDWATFERLTRRHVIDCEIALTSEVTGQKQFLPDYFLERLYREYEGLTQAIFGSRLNMSEQRNVMRDANTNFITGTLFYAAVYKPEVGEFLPIEGLTRGQNQSARWMHLTSVILAPVDYRELARSVSGGAPMDLGMELFSSTNHIARETWLNISEGAPRATDPQFKPYLTHRAIWPMYGHRFSIFFYTTPLFEAQSPRRLAKIAMAAGTGLTLLATALVGVALRARNRQELLTDQISEARDALAAAQQERNKISRDLHDGTIQSLYAIQLGLGHTLKRLQGEPAKAGSELSAVRRELDSVIAEIRQFISADNSAGQPVEFGAVLQALVQRAQAATSARIELQCDPAASARLSGDQAVQLANIAREALSNSVRHGNPRHARIALRSAPDAVTLEISDDGSGFDPKSPRRNGVGLPSIAARAQEAGGTLDVQSAPGEGTRITVRVAANSMEPVGAESAGSWMDAS